jgi:hypothetical protein
MPSTSNPIQYCAPFVTVNGEGKTSALLPDIGLTSVVAEATTVVMVFDVPLNTEHFRLPVKPVLISTVPALIVPSKAGTNGEYLDAVATVFPGTTNANGVCTKLDGARDHTTLASLAGILV